MNLKHLKEIGLTDGQITVYNAILELGVCTLSKIHEKTQMERRNIYDVVSKLLKKGLIVSSLEDKKKTYRCTHPDMIKETIKSKIQNLQKLENEIPNISERFNELKENTNGDLIRGDEAIKALLYEALDYKEIHWLGGSCGIEKTRLKFWFNQWMKLRSYKKIAMYDLVNTGTYLEEYPRSKKQQNEKSRYYFNTLPTSLRIFAPILIFGNKIVQISFEEGPLAFVVESKEIKESYLRIFNHFWKGSTTETKHEDTIKIGIIHSLTGTMAISEVSLVDTILMAVDQINEKGGILGKKLQAIIVDGRSDGETFAKEAEKLITEENVCSIFGGWTSESRKTMIPVLEKYNHLLWYPVEYEGLEMSPNIVYLGSTPNQQVIPAIEWAKKTVGKKFFLIGSDYVFPKSVNEIIKNLATKKGIKIVGEEYKKLGETNFKEIVKLIKAKKPDIIFNTINGDSNVAFFNELKKQRISSQEIPTISMSLGEDEIRHIDPKVMEGHYSSWNYFQSIKNKENQKFVTSFKKRYGLHRTISDPMEKSYIAIQMFEQAVKKAGIDDVSAIKKSLKNLELICPEGKVVFDPKTQNTIKKTRIGKIKEDGQFEIVWQSKGLIKPQPYPKTKKVREWKIFLNKLYDGWGGRWSYSDEQDEEKNK